MSAAEPENDKTTPETKDKKVTTFPVEDTSSHRADLHPVHDWFGGVPSHERVMAQSKKLLVIFMLMLSVAAGFLGGWLSNRSNLNVSDLTPQQTKQTII